MTDRRFRIWVAVATALALVVRVAWVRYASHQPEGLYDPARYLGYARSIASGKGMIEWTGHPTAYYPPGYPWFLGIVAWLSKPFTSNVTLVAGLVQAGLGAATCGLGAVVARRVAGRTAGVVAAFGLALYPNLVFHTAALLGETLYIFLFLAFAALLLRRPLDEPVSPQAAVAVGLVLGLAIMVRPISLAVVPVVAGAWWLARRDGRAVARTTALLLVGVVACIAPWTIRNQVRMHQFVPISTNTGDNLCIGNNPDANGAFNMSMHCAIGSPLESPAAEVAADHDKTSYAIDQIKDRPGRQPWLVWRRGYYMWIHSGDHDGLGAVQSYYADPWMGPRVHDDLVRVADAAYWVVVAVGGAGAVLLVVRRRPEGLFVVGAAVMTALVPLAFFGDSRFKVPVIPLLIIAAAAWADLLRPEPEPHPEPHEPHEPHEMA